MQTNVDAITAAATATGLFETVSDHVFVEVSAFPALCVWQRRCPQLDKKDESARLWTRPWLYDVAILVKGTFSELEAVEASFDAALIARDGKVTGRSQYEAMVSQFEVVVSSFTVRRGHKTDFPE